MNISSFDDSLIGSFIALSFLTRSPFASLRARRRPEVQFHSGLLWAALGCSGLLLGCCWAALGCSWLLWAAPGCCSGLLWAPPFKTSTIFIDPSFQKVLFLSIRVSPNPYFCRSDFRQTTIFVDPGSDRGPTWPKLIQNRSRRQVTWLILACRPRWTVFL